MPIFIVTCFIILQAGEGIHLGLKIYKIMTPGLIVPQAEVQTIAPNINDLISDFCSESKTGVTT